MEALYLSTSLGLYGLLIIGAFKIRAKKQNLDKELYHERYKY